jgi:exosortase F-associated protein
MHNRRRWILVVLSVVGLLAVFLFQNVNLAALLEIADKRWVFIFNRIIRFIINDVLAIILIYALFVEKKYVVFSIYVQLAGMIFILLPYFVFKFYYPAYNGPLISFLHRLIFNPTLLLLLIPAFYFQKEKEKR